MMPKGIRLIQERLLDRGLLDAGAFHPRELDEATLEAIADLQKEEGLAEVGLPTYGTVRALGLEPSAVYITGDASCEGGS